MASLVIVGIPEENDYVHKISTEKIPHITLIFLGDPIGKPVMKIQQFLEHAVNILELGPFGLEVEKRGTLGEQDADVLFFRKNWSLKRVKEFRGQLLKNQAIRSAYDATEQWDEYPDGWTPHLTLGYPGAPAREDKRDYPGIRWVEFDRIALWYGDYEGPEFQLEYNYDLAEVAMGETSEAGKEFLEHFGVRGMRWGVRKDRTPLPIAPSAQSVVKRNKNIKTKITTEGGHNHPATEDALKVAATRQKMRKSGTAALSNKELKELQERLNLEVNVTRLDVQTTTSPGRKFVNKFLADPHKTVSTVNETVGTGTRAVSEINTLLKERKR